VKMMFRQISAAVLLITAAVAAQASIVYQNNFDAGSASLSGFTSFGNATSQVLDGQLAVGVSSLNEGGVSLYTGSLAGYSTTLSENVGTVTWAFDVANSDGTYNNGFRIVLAGNTSNPYGLAYNQGFPSEGYSLSGGEYAGNRMLFSRFYNGATTYQTLIDVPDGLGTLPQTGAIRITYEPSSDTWSFYMDTGLNYTDPTADSQLIGTVVDGTYTHEGLPYFSLAGEYSGTDYLDNLSISVVPEPSPLCLVVVLGLTTFYWQAYLSRRARKV
jgi:hypothetical protein